MGGVIRAAEAPRPPAAAAGGVPRCGLRGCGRGGRARAAPVQAEARGLRRRRRVPGGPATHRSVIRPPLSLSRSLAGWLSPSLMNLCVGSELLPGFSLAACWVRESCAPVLLCSSLASWLSRCSGFCCARETVAGAVVW